MTEHGRGNLRRTIHADREGIVGFLTKEMDQAAASVAEPGHTRRAQDRYRGRRDGLGFAISAIEDLEPEFGGFPVEARFAHPGAGYPAEVAKIQEEGELEPGKVYTIRTMEVGQSSTYLTLHGVQGSYGAQMFEPVWPHENDADEPEYKVTEPNA